MYIYVPLSYQDITLKTVKRSVAAYAKLAGLIIASVMANGVSTKLVPRKRPTPRNSLDTLAKAAPPSLFTSGASSEEAAMAAAENGKDHSVVTVPASTRRSRDVRGASGGVGGGLYR